MDFFRPPSAALLLLFIFSDQALLISGLGAVGVNYGLNGDNLPVPSEVVELYGRCGIDIVRVFEPNHWVLDALKGRRNLVVWLGTRNEDIQGFAADQLAANSWVNAHVVPYYESVNIAYITVGNEVVPDDAAAPFVANAIKNIMQALVIAGVKSDIKVTTVVPMTPLEVSYPPSAGAFSATAIGPLKDITRVLGTSGAPLLLNVYPYFAYASNPQQISLDYALFTSTTPVVVDGNLQYFNLFDAMVDSFYSALEKIGAEGVRIDISETGWPSKGNDPLTSVENAATYNRNFVEHVRSGAGTPRRPNVKYDGVLFEMFNENLKTAGVEQNFGLFYSNMLPVYSFWNC
ncbi:probable glucan endo-1,3-beta-glucosidase BG4 [Cucurbita pepo subsp. pepo]|uniref:probable glucan endo-1,3-beta-glucosidase BG4 n=1 Tax=Cucurbita pepo subsp. pepo TaxID=3664 RepID=UPI000C9D4E4E|nr:probable glucan endo-1,3-beta-glucosidase BG4 [Cucurbita pepo subsp. pepo]